MSSLYQQLNPTRQLPSNLTSMIKNIKSMANPQAMLNNMMQNNPKLKSVMDASNGNYEKAFRDLAKDMNIDADELIRMLK